MTRFTVQVLRLALPAALVMLCPACRLPWSAPAPPPRVEAGRSIAPPRVDGRCDDPAYSGAATLPLEDPSGRQAGRAHVLHDGLDLFVCVDGLDAAAARRATVRLDPVVAGGSPAALELTGDLEQRVDLSRVGGFGRSVGLAVSVDQAAWPSPRGEARTGELVLGPTYSAAPAGSVFVDGRRGFLAIPGAAALHPSELTVEAWVRPAEGACGALLSGGAGDLYLGLCGSLAYGPAGRASAVTTRTQLDGGWHHL
ncbi:MAG TPA: hypothetical protein VFA20_06800, partial [Myxococcaceae bacterium]|nr:hypothetical protein [Myxococcaceae bacterium]